MPELPDVETFKRLADRRALGRAIVRTSIRECKVLGRSSAQRICKALHGKRFVGARPIAAVPGIDARPRPADLFFRDGMR